MGSTIGRGRGGNVWGFLALSRKEKGYEIRREIRTLQSPDKGGGGRHGEKRESRAERKYGGCFVGCELVEGKAGLIGGNWGYPRWICIQIGEGFAGRPCRPDRRGKGCAGANAGDVIGDQIGRKDGGFRGGLPCPAKAVSPQRARLPAVRQRRHAHSSAGKSPGSWNSCRRRHVRLLAPRPRRRRSFLRSRAV